MNCGNDDSYSFENDLMFQIDMDDKDVLELCHLESILSPYNGMIIDNKVGVDPVPKAEDSVQTMILTTAVYTMPRLIIPS